MSSIRKQVLVNGQAHFIEVNSSLELDEVEVTGTDPASGKVVQVSLSPLLKPSQRPENQSPYSFGSPQNQAPSWPSFGESAVPSPASIHMFDPPSSPAPMDMFNELPNPNITPPLSITPPSTPQAPAQGGWPIQEQPAFPLQPPADPSAPSTPAKKDEKEEVDDTLRGMYRY